MKIFTHGNMNNMIAHYICLILISGCISQALGENPSENSDILNTINNLKDKAKDIKRPEDIPLVKEWMEACKEKVGGRMWRVIKSTPKRMVDCFTKYVKYKKLQVEVNESMPRGDLDLVFKKYCGRREKIMACLDDAVEIVKPCLDEKQMVGLNTTLDALDAGIDFTCFENGDRIALFMAEEGVQCVKNTSESIKNCIHSKIPKLKDVEADPWSTKVDLDFFNEQNCKEIWKVHQCVVSSTSVCDDPTPANILDSLIIQAIKATPCAQSPTYALNASNGFYPHFWTILPHVLIIILSGLTAAHILL